MRKAAERYTNTVEAKRAAHQRDLAQRNETLRKATATVTKSLHVPALAAIKPKIVTSSRAEPTVALEIPAALKFRFPHPVWLMCRLRMPENSLESVQVDGLGIYGDLVALPRSGPQRPPGKADDHAREQLGRLLDAPQLRQLVEKIAHEAPDEASLGAKVTAWAERAIDHYFQLTEADWERNVREEEEVIGTRVSFRTRTTALFAFGAGQGARINFKER